jgi:hypothetical protein
LLSRTACNAWDVKIIESIVGVGEDRLSSLSGRTRTRI